MLLTPHVCSHLSDLRVRRGRSQEDLQEGVSDACRSGGPAGTVLCLPDPEHSQLTGQPIRQRPGFRVPVPQSKEVKASSGLTGCELSQMYTDWCLKESEIF